jgi:hypothetical protein
LSLCFIGNSKTRISNIVVVYIDAVIFVHSFIYFQNFLQEEGSNEYYDC